ncbi:MAG: twin-arginine translocase subunit TatC [Flavobacteriaceae bacterium]
MANNKNEMSFLGHLEELRWHLVRSFVAIFALAVVLFIFQTQVYEYFLLAHLKPDFITYQWFCEAFGSIGIESSFCNVNFPQKLQSLSLTNQLMNSLWTSAILGLILAFPYIIYELWKFIAPGLHENERKNSRGFIFVTSFLFFLGLLFSYFIICPMSVYFFYNYQITDLIVNNFQFESYISIITNALLGISLVFELPVLIYFLSKAGLVTPQFLKTYRKHALVVILILSAIITPPDIASQIIVSIPVMFLYEIGIYISKFVEKKRLKKEKQLSNVK